MRLDLRKIIDNPGSSLSFDFAVDTEFLDFDSVLEYISAPRAEGRVYNEAGVLRLEGGVRAGMKCVCDRCCESFEREKLTRVDVVLTEEDREEELDLFILDNCAVDLQDVMSTCFILDMDSKTLCDEDCKGLCPDCGKNLNQGPCGCTKPRDPRFAVLEQLLDKLEE